ncbi:hypothetical protein CLIB1423_02S09934 [[Candida] railenensis]|uniref:non-specific serine/threonine protein kinase n=1 Tax=[Candida] railenensis TaxID=45579 RepID=A0A9P0QM15_9ASCO|nr:hypothetical protein CLIB1423_02S09934 [[Candida] railenensis]
MPLFRSSSKKKEASVSPPVVGRPVSRSNSLKSSNSTTSMQSIPQIVTNGHSNGGNVSGNTSPTTPTGSKLRSFLKSSPKVSASTPDLGKKSEANYAELDSVLDVDSLRISNGNGNGFGGKKEKRISTIVETEGDENGEGGSDFDDENYDDESDDGDDDDDDSESDSDYEEHLHIIKPKGKAISGSMHLLASQIKAYCGITNPSKLTEVANEESKRTFSLLDDKLKIYKVSSTTNRNDPRLKEPVISEIQVESLQQLTQKIDDLFALKGDRKAQLELASKGKTLFDRYGCVKNVIGRGAYGLIKIIEPQETAVKGRSGSITANDNTFVLNNKYFAVKELHRRGTEKDPEPQQNFIERVLSEFMISSTLNYKHIVKTVDLMVSLPALGEAAVGECNRLKINQVMECTAGGDLFTYMTTMKDKFNKPISYMGLDELDCFIKQISKGLWYMHQHGVSHCDLKLENILISYAPSHTGKYESISPHQSHAKIILKLSDFGKSNVFRTKWDKADQITPFSTGPIGSEPYLAPEEFGNLNCNGVGGSSKIGFSSPNKDNWALGIIILVLFNIKKNYYYFKSGAQQSKNGDVSASSADLNNLALSSEYSSGYLWHSTEPKRHHLRKDKKFKDKNFDEYIIKRMKADYECKSKEWVVHRKGTYKPIETLFDAPRFADDDEDDYDSHHNVDFSGLINGDPKSRSPTRANGNSNGYLEEEEMDQDEKDLCELRKMFIYKLLDPDPDTRLTVEQFLKSDWMRGVETCV